MSDILNKDHQRYWVRDGLTGDPVVYTEDPDDPEGSIIVWQSPREKIAQKAAEHEYQAVRGYVMAGMDPWKNDA